MITYCEEKLPIMKEKNLNKFGNSNYLNFHYIKTIFLFNYSHKILFTTDHFSSQ